MSLPINIENLLSGAIVEGERIEFKEGWNPGPIMRTVCAFANDFENLGSGYIVVGVKEENGKPLRPVLGFPTNQFDKVQQEMIGFSNLVQPPYFPRLFLEAIDGKQVLVIWVPAGSNRPYKVPREVGAKQKDFQYYIRQYSSTIVPPSDKEIELIQLTSKIPFDDRVSTQHPVDALSFSLMREHLHKTESKLYEESGALSVKELAIQMNLAEGAKEHLFPKHVGLLMWSNFQKDWGLLSFMKKHLRAPSKNNCKMCWNT
jgi:ATP-dependent DNA helicase RecG